MESSGIKPGPPWDLIGKYNNQWVRCLKGPQGTDEIKKILAMVESRNADLAHIISTTGDKNSKTCYIDVIVMYEGNPYKFVVKYHPEKRERNYLHAECLGNSDLHHNVKMQIDGIFHEWLKRHPRTSHMFS